MAYIYALRSIDSSDYFYVGSTRKGIAQRLSRHIQELRNGKHKNKRFVAAAHAVGIDNITCDILTIVPDRYQYVCEGRIIRHLLITHPLVNKMHNDIDAFALWGYGKTFARDQREAQIKDKIDRLLWFFLDFPRRYPEVNREEMHKSGALALIEWIIKTSHG